jgi:CheY-like chemotaxis protein
VDETILTVDDHKDNAETVALAPRHCGFRVVMTANPHVVLVHLSEQPSALLLCDVDIQRPDGVALVGRIRFPRLPAKEVLDCLEHSIGTTPVDGDVSGIIDQAVLAVPDRCG